MTRPPLTWTTMVSQNREPVAVEVEGSVVMMSLEREHYYSLEGTGGRIWELLESPRPIAEICEHLVKEYEIDLMTCRDQVMEFLVRLRAEGLITVHDEPADPV